MLLSQRCEYAIRCALYVAAADAGAYTRVQEVSATLGIPGPFLAKLIQPLARAGILRSLRGRSGGIALARPAASITLRDVVLAVDGPDVFTVCVLRLPGCGEARPCPLHAGWLPIRERIERLFGEATLAAVAAATESHGFRLASFVGAPGGGA